MPGELKNKFCSLSAGEAAEQFARRIKMAEDPTVQALQQGFPQTILTTYAELRKLAQGGLTVIERSDPNTAARLRSVDYTPRILSE